MMKRFLALLVLATLILAGCGNTPEPMDSDDAERQAAVDDVMATAEGMLDMVYGDGNYELEYDTDSATLDILLSGFGIGIDDIATLTKDDEALSELWRTVTDATTPICDELYKMVENAGVENYDVTANILSGKDTLLTVLNGDVTYDAVGDTATSKPKSDAAFDDLCATLKETLEDDFAWCEVTHDSDRVIVNICGDNLGAALAATSARDIVGIIDSWEKMKENVVALAQSIGNTIAAAGYENVPTTLFALDETNHAKVFLKIVDGVVVYDIMTSLVAKAYAELGISEPSSATPTPAAPTKGEKNALAKAKDYLAFMPFSYSGLINQLEFEGYTTSEATYGADHCGADWNEQAAEKAKDYLDFMAFSRQGLIDQLKYEGFTDAQAIYGVTAVGY